MLTGPSVVSCFNSADGMGACLRGKMADAGLVPAAPAPALAETETPAGDDAGEVAALAQTAPAPETADVAETPDVAEPALDVAPPAAMPDVPDDLVAATFGLLRAEPDGSVVIAGSGTPGSEVEIFSNGDLLGSAQVEASGDWVFVPDRKLPPGGAEITLGEAGKSGQAAESFVVVIDKDKTSQPLVVASTPGQASEVLQGLAVPAAADTQVATAEPAMTQSKPAEPVPAAPAAASPAEEPVRIVPEAPAAAPVETETAAIEPVASPGEAAASAPEAPAEAPAALAAPAPDAPEPAADESASAPAPQAPAEPAEPAVAARVEEPAATPAPEAAPAPQAEPAASAEPAPSTAEPEPEAVPPPAKVPPTIDAIEIEGDSTYFAGAGPDKGVVRLYVDDSFIADAVVDGGRWLIEAGKVLTKPTQRIRVDLLDPDSAKVTARAEVDFVVDLPLADAPLAIADAEKALDKDKADTALPPASPAQDEPVAPAATETPAASEPASEPAEAPAPIPAVEPAAPAVEPAAPTAEPAAPAAEPDVPTMVAVSLGDPDAERFAAGKAIIRRGDNLWTIARRVYGEGIKFTTIYQANSGQIRDPDWIYPGQVFDLPETAP